MRAIISGIAAVAIAAGLCAIAFDVHSAAPQSPGQAPRPTDLERDIREIATETLTLLRQSAENEDRQETRLRGEAYARLAYVHASLDNAAEAKTIIAEADAALNRVGESRTSDQLPKGKALTDLALAQHLTGDGAGANSSLALSHRLADGLGWDLWEHSELLKDIARARMQMGDRAAARAILAEAGVIANKILPVDRRSVQIGHMSEIAALRGELDMAEQFAELTRTGFTNDSGIRATAHALAVITIVEAKIEKNDKAGALADLARIHDVVLQVWRAQPLLGRFAIAQLRAGDVAASRATIQAGLTMAVDWSQDWRRAQMFGLVAEAQAANGDTNAGKATIALALAAARKISDAADRVQILRPIALSQHALADTDGAKQTLAEATAGAASIRDKYRQAFALASTAHAYAQIGAVELAHDVMRRSVEVAKQVTSRERRADLLDQSARGQAKWRDLTGARATALLHDTIAARARALADVAKTLLPGQLKEEPSSLAAEL